MEGPLVSIVTVTYNSASYVRDAIESVLSQTYTNIEYIIADDCSPDNTWDIIRGYNDPRIVAYRNDNNLGEYPNRNKALRMARGKYFMFIDGDDIIYSHGIAFFVHMMEQFPDAAFAVQKNYYNNLLYPALISSRDILINYYFGKVSFLTSSFASNFFKTDLLQKDGLSTRYKVGDEEVRLRLACHHPVLLVAGWVTWPRETPGQASVRIKNYERNIELYNITRDLNETGALKRLGNGLDELIISKLTGLLKKDIIKNWLKGRFGEAKSLMKRTSLAWPDLLERRKALVYVEDFLAHSTSAQPYKTPVPTQPL